MAMTEGFIRRLWVEVCVPCGCSYAQEIWDVSGWVRTAWGCKDHTQNSTPPRPSSWSAPYRCLMSHIHETVCSVYSGQTINIKKKNGRLLTSGQVLLSHHLTDGGAVVLQLTDSLIRLLMFIFNVLLNACKHRFNTLILWRSTVQL